MLIDCINDRIKLTEVPLWLTVRKLVRVGVWVRSKLTVSGRLRHQLPTKHSMPGAKCNGTGSYRVAFDSYLKGICMKTVGDGTYAITRMVVEADTQFMISGTQFYD